ncbi:MAG: flagellar filament capping protein FliD [Candidatus Nanopelagicales bacterium]
MAFASVSGLASGLDTASIIDQLMAVEAGSQTRLKSRVTSEQTTVSTLQKLNAMMASLAGTSANLTKPGALTPMTATSSSTHVTALPQAGATAGALSVVVDSVALAHRMAFTATAARTDLVTGASTVVRLTSADGTQTDLDTGDGTLDGLLSALNASGTNVRASTLRLDDGTYRLIVESATTGAASSFALTALDGSALLGGATVRAGQDAALTVGTDTVHSSTNTFSGVLPGVDITLSAATPPGTAVDLSVATDAGSAVESVRTFVKAVNTALNDLATATKSGSGAKSALAGDTSLTSLRSALTSAVFPTDGTSLAQWGIQLDRSGQLTFDEAQFTDAYAADPSAVAVINGADGFAARIQAVAEGASDSIDGTLTTAISGRNTQIGRLQDSVDSWDIRLELRRNTLTRQFAALETALSTIQSQSAWLTSQIDSLSSS